MDSHLVEVQPHNTRGILRAAPVANLHILITQKEQELKSLQDELGLIEQVLARNSLSSPVARVHMYEGPESTKQIRHNILNATSEVVSLLFKDIAEEADAEFINRWIKNANGHELRFRTIYDDRLKQAHQNSQPEVLLTAGETRYVSSRLLPISYSIMTYDNVVASLQWQDNQLYGTEIYSADMAATQHAFFELLWQQAKA
jgi:hypothetical protein